MKSLILIGSKSLCLKILKIILKQKFIIKCLITFDDTYDQRSYFKKIKSFCKRKKVKLFVVENNKYESEEIIKRYKIDYVLVIGWYKLFSKRILKHPSNFFLGIHQSMLPKYRGGAPLVWQIINNEKSVGYTIFKFNPGIDSGDIIFQESIKITRTQYINDIMNRLELKIINFFESSFLETLIKKKFIKMPADQSKIYSQRKPIDGKINWNDSSEKIYNFVRAQSYPYPGAFSYFNNKKYIIWKASTSSKKIVGNEGDILKLNNNLYVKCGKNSTLRLDKYDIVKS